MKAKDQQACPQCGMERADWPDQGFAQGNDRYCCQGCAENTGCTCPESGSGASTTGRQQEKTKKSA